VGGSSGAWWLGHRRACGHGRRGCPNPPVGHRSGFVTGDDLATGSDTGDPSSGFVTGDDLATGSDTGDPSSGYVTGDDLTTGSDTGDPRSGYVTGDDLTAGCDQRPGQGVAPMFDGNSATH
jgi:hypothetical protein